MKKLIALFTAATLLFGICACTATQSEGRDAEEPQAPTWQEQYDLGIRYLSEGNYQEAIIAFTAAIEIDPKQAPAYVGRGDAYVLSGDLEENLTAAKTDYETAIELDETLADAYLGLANIYILQDEIESAILVLQQGLSITGDSRCSERLLALEGKTEHIHNEFEQLLYAGKTDNMLSFEEITFLGEPLRKFTIEEIISKMSSLGMDIYENNEGDHYYASADFERLSFGPSVSAFQSKSDNYASLLGYDSGVVENDIVNIGIRNMMTRSTMGALFTALGFSNGNEIDAFICELIETDYGSFDELTNAFHVLNYSDEYLHIYHSSTAAGQLENGRYRLDQLTFSLYLNRCGGYNLSFTFGGNPEFEDCLTDYSIYISD